MAKRAVKPVKEIVHPRTTVTMKKDNLYFKQGKKVDVIEDCVQFVKVKHPNSDGSLPQTAVLFNFELV